MDDTPSTGSAAQSRNQLRSSYAEAWRRHTDGLPLSPLDALLSDVVALHPEYQPLVSDLNQALAADPKASADTENPFLHLGLHVAVREQLSIDRPPGVRELHQRLTAQSGDPHHAEHVMMEALAETLWEAQRSGRAPDELQYLNRARGRLTR